MFNISQNKTDLTGLTWDTSNEKWHSPLSKIKLYVPYLSVSLPFVWSRKRTLYVAAVIQKANWQRTCITWCHPICKWNIDDPRLHKETILTGAHFMNDFSIVIQIRRRFYSAVIPFTASDRYDYLHGTRAGLSRHLQNFVALWYHIIELH